jgi:hypothetical protein
MRIELEMENIKFQMSESTRIVNLNLKEKDD